VKTPTARSATIETQTATVFMAASLTRPPGDGARGLPGTRAVPEAYWVRAPRTRPCRRAPRSGPIDSQKPPSPPRVAAPSRPPVTVAAVLLLTLALVAAACSHDDGARVGASTAASPGSEASSVPAPARSGQLAIRPAGYRLPAPIERAVAVRDGQRVLIAGGLDTSGTTVGGVFALDPASGKLTSLGSLPSPVHDAAGAMIGGRLLVFGGGSAAGTDLVQSFDPATGAGQVAGHLPVVLSDLSAVAIGPTVYLVGGYDGSAPRREIYATTDGARFRLVARLPLGLRYPAVAASGGTIVVAGGQGPHGLSSAVYGVDPGTGSVHRIASLPTAVAHAAAFATQGVTYVVGGRDAADTPVDRVWRLEPGATKLAAVRRLPVATSDAAVAAAGGGTLLIGGATGAGAATSAQVLRATVGTGAAPSAGASPSPGPTPLPSVSAAATSAAARARPFAGLLLIADRGNDRLLVMNARKRIVWTYPSPSLPAPRFRFYFPDDAFFVHGGHAILINEEENDLLAEIAYPSGRTLWTYGHAGVAGSSPGYVHQPDDLYPMPGGGVVVADAKNCRILFLDAAGRVDHQIGSTGNCTPAMPRTVGYPNGDTPLRNGHLLVSELNGARVSEVTRTGRIIWSHQIPGVVEPSDPQRLADGTFMVASYARPGAVIRFDMSGNVLWSYHPSGGPGMLDHPSLAIPLPNGLVAVNDDYRHRVVLIDPKTNRIVWQYGTGTAGSGPGQLAFPDGMDLMLPGNVLPLHVDFASKVVKAGRP
jgi:outer membrane protein assembly factor BamB